MELRILDLDGSVTAQHGLQPLTTANRRKRRIRERAFASPSHSLASGNSNAASKRCSVPVNDTPALTLYGSGDFHHVTLALLRRLTTPFNLLVLDKHPDWATAAKAFPRRPRVFFEEWNDPLISGIQWVEELIEIAGGDVIFPELRSCGKAQDRVVESAEVARRNPEVILASWCGMKVDKDAICSRAGWAETGAGAETATFTKKCLQEQFCNRVPRR